MAIPGAGFTFASADNRMREALLPLGAEFISAQDLLCNADGCLIRLGEAATDIVVYDQLHLTEKGSEFLIGAIVDRVLAPPGDRN